MRRPDLIPDCGSCTALCCVATSFDASAEFAFSKRAMEPCRNLCSDHRCAIHAELVQRGFRGCAAYDCYGAGQRITRELPVEQRHAALSAYRDLHELIWLLTEAAKLCPVIASDIAAEVAALDALTPTDENLVEHRAVTQALLLRVRDALSR